MALLAYLVDSDVEDQVGVGRDARALRWLRAVCQRGWYVQPARTALFHAWDALGPAGDYLAEAEGYGLASVFGALENLAGAGHRAGVIDGHRIARLDGCAGTRRGVFGLEFRDAGCWGKVSKLGSL